jgi:hypothetical protein
MMALCNSATLLKAPRRMWFRVISAKKRPTMLSHEAEVGVSVVIWPTRHSETRSARQRRPSGDVCTEKMCRLVKLRGTGA